MLSIALEQLAGHAGFSGITPLLNMLEEIYDETRRFQSIANKLGIDKSLATTIVQHMQQKWSDLKI
ncbi:hypothetical protein ABLB69_05495 [Xenorhabdus khoisanae]|uniref:hypothetical protein n=1 Tax=Xenorhabdus khoisanae TaxID=880157 RepID=UPI0032B8322D